MRFSRVFHLRIPAFVCDSALRLRRWLLWPASPLKNNKVGAANKQGSILRLATALDVKYPHAPSAFYSIDDEQENIPAIEPPPLWTKRSPPLSSQTERRPRLLSEHGRQNQLEYNEYNDDADGETSMLIRDTQGYGSLPAHDIPEDEYTVLLPEPNVRRRHSISVVPGPYITPSSEVPLAQNRVAELPLHPAPLAPDLIPHNFNSSLRASGHHQFSPQNYDHRRQTLQRTETYYDSSHERPEVYYDSRPSHSRIRPGSRSWDGDTRSLVGPASQASLPSADSVAESSRSASTLRHHHAASPQPPPLVHTPPMDLMNLVLSPRPSSSNWASSSIVVEAMEEAPGLLPDPSGLPPGLGNMPRSVPSSPRPSFAQLPARNHGSGTSGLLDRQLDQQLSRTTNSLSDVHLHGPVPVGWERRQQMSTTNRHPDPSSDSRPLEPQPSGPSVRIQDEIGKQEVPHTQQLTQIVIPGDDNMNHDSQNGSNKTSDSAPVTRFRSSFNREANPRRHRNLCDARKTTAENIILRLSLPVSLIAITHV
ncbi:hypothetical protein AcW1_008231 [Taiwanofungus camphoratus]|nr:hypothetical protein AcW1_008231 [Antrodia cinnamomea]KAI0955995.1 hypothetical protein AcV7_006517 [Antrodia cinnamomea]